MAIACTDLARNAGGILIRVRKDGHLVLSASADKGAPEEAEQLDFLESIAENWCAAGVYFESYRRKMDPDRKVKRIDLIIINMTQNPVPQPEKV